MTNSILPTKFKPGTIVVYNAHETYVVLSIKQVKTGTEITYLSTKDIFVIVYEPEFKNTYNVL